MAPKSKKKKSKKKVKDPEQEALEIKRQEFIKQAQDLTNEIANEEKTKKEFTGRLAQTKINWSMEKKNVESKKRTLRNKEDQLKWINEKHTSDIESTKDHIKYLLYQQQNDYTTLKNNEQVQLYNIQQNNATDVEKKSFNVTEYQARLKEVEISHNDFMFQLHRDHDEQVEKLREEFKRKFHLTTADSEKNIKIIREEKEIRMKDEVKMLEEEKEKQTRVTEKVYEEKLGKLRTQYNKSLHEELDKIQDLKTDLSKSRRDLKQAEKMCKECESKNKSIVEPFTKAKDSLEVLNKDAKEFNQEKSKLERKKATLKVDEKKLKDLQWRHEVLFQKYELLEREYIDTKEKLAESKLENQQRCSMNDMILLKKISDVDDIANDHILVLSKMLAKDNDIKPLKIECGGNLNEKETSLSIDGLDRMQSEMQRLHNAFIGRRSATIGHSVIPEDVAIL